MGQGELVPQLPAPLASREGLDAYVLLFELWLRRCLKWKEGLCHLSCCRREDSLLPTLGEAGGEAGGEALSTAGISMKLGSRLTVTL
mmetsp:Transcript_89676/g.277348  ORF Transcript_89676/g.277348 Transcript_89676/m.277348 type:complete len:87 (+) Transcript_89676:433-693(+)